MSTGFRRSEEGGHDVIYDYSCSPCEGKGFNAEAQFYCKGCKQLFCGTCETFHDRFFRSHQVLERKEVAKWGDVKPVTSSFMCDEHLGKELEMYCEDHDCICCHICISVKHRICKQVKPVLEVSKGIQKKSEFKSFLSEAAKAQSRLKTLRKKQEDNIKMLQKARVEVTSNLKNMRKKLNEIVDRLEEDSTTEMARLIAMLNEQVASDKDFCSNLLNKIQKFIEDIQTLGKHCDELVFQSYKKCSEQMVKAEKLLSSLRDVDYQLKFTPDVNIEQYLSSLETLGSFQVKKQMNDPDHVYSVVNKQTYNIKISGDTETCGISGICKLPDGHTVITDFLNNKVKLLSTSAYCVLDALKLPPYPQDICHLMGTELAVTVSEKKGNKFIKMEIQFINAGSGKLSHTRTVQLGHECGGIAYHNAQLYVGSKNALYIYNMFGKKIEKLFENTSAKCTTVCRFSLSDDASRIYVTNLDHHLFFTLDGSGHHLSNLSDPKLQKPRGVCVVDDGIVFVCGMNSHTVLQVEREGKRKMTTLVTKTDGVCFPLCLCYDRKTQTLLVGQDENDDLLALHLK